MSHHRPNILLITTDQQRYDTAGSAAPSFLRTPHFDHLGRDGVIFSRAYADCPLCVPSRMSIMTGQYVVTHGMTGNGRSADLLTDSRKTLPGCLNRLGYQTAAIGKMHFTPQRARHGFQEMILPEDYYRQMRHSGTDLQPMRHGLGQNELYPSLATVPESLTLTSWTAEQCVEYIRERRDPTAPFFLWCSFSKPHPPLDPPEPYYSMYRDSPIPEAVIGEWAEGADLPYAMRRAREKQGYDLIPPETIRAARAAYYGLITQIDYNMGRVFAALQDMDLFDEALILYASDHGEYLGDHRCGAKSFFHEPSAHVPLALRMPQSWSNSCYGMENDSLVTLADILPTVVRAAGGEPPPDVDGQDLIALARGESEGRHYLEATSGPQEYCGITDGRWKYIWYPLGGSEQLFDLAADPHERHNLAGSSAHAGQQTRLQRELRQRLASRNSPAVVNGDLVTLPLPEETTADRRRQGWPGYHTEYYDVDVRH